MRRASTTGQGRRGFGLRLPGAALLLAAAGGFALTNNHLSARPWWPLAVDRELGAAERVAERKRLPRRNDATNAALATRKPAFDPTAAETSHNKKIDALLVPLLSYAVPGEEISRLKDALAAISERNHARAREIEASLGDRAAKKLVRWALLRSPHAEPTAAEIEEFRRANPDFPDQGALRQKAEEHLLTKVADQKAIIDFFAASPPQTGAGFAALAAAHFGLGDKEAARTLLVKAWREHDLGAAIEATILSGMGSLLGEADHKWRLDRLLMRDIRWAGERAERAAVARRLVPLLSAPEQQKANARLAVYLRQANAAQLMAALPAEAKKDPGVMLQRIQLARRSKQYTEAFALLAAAPTDKAIIVSPDDWWPERRANAYAALKLGQVKTAYQIASRNGPLTVNPLKDAEHFSGWIAFRLLNDAALAEKHFLAMRKAADGPISKATAEYWLGRIALARNDAERARQHFKAASAFNDTFYGLASIQMLDRNATRLRAPAPPGPSEEEAGRFLARDAVKAVMLARAAGQDAIARTFLGHLRYHLQAPGETLLVAHLSVALGDTQAGVRTGKWAIARGHNLLYYAYPTHAFPAYSPLRKAPEPAFLLGIARQESEFNTLTLSGAGARGVLQVMPITARHVCRDYKITCDIPRLLTDPAYNTMLASAYIGDRMAEFSGSYVLTLAGYNAGPGRVREWLREFGDPRDPAVDPIDWIERIPFEETRDSVKKVLSNVQVYRARLGEEATALQILSDLVRARGEKGLPPAETSATPGADEEPEPKAQ